MTTIAVELADVLASRFARACSSAGHGEGAVAAGLFRRYLEVEQLRRNLAEARLANLYQSLAAEDMALAESGIGDYQRDLIQTDQP